MASPTENGEEPRRLGLNETESKLRRLLLDVAKYINAEKPSELRFTGGWVRDKLLGVGSHDIDVAINDMTGYQFALRMKEYLEIPENSEKHDLVDSSASKKGEPTAKNRLVGGLHKIEANPEKSKHLETVTTRVFGLDIDMVNLRKEIYDELSRNPQMEFGTPKEDADRRDANINAMFYNLQTEQVEDFTGRGLEDLQRHVIATPLEPLQTFRDDPLRVLRLIRFASRLAFRIDPNTEDAMKDESVKDTLRIKISRERIGVELEKMLKGPDPHIALEKIHELNLYTTIFSDPTTAQTYKPETASWNAYYNFVEAFLHTPSPIKDILIHDEAEKYLAWMLCCFVPYADAPEPVTPKGAKTLPPLAAVIAREGIKANSKVFDVISASVTNHSDIMNIKTDFLAASRSDQKANVEPEPKGRATLGMAIRRWGPTWRNQVLYALLLDVGSHPETRNIVSTSNFLSAIENNHGPLEGWLRFLAYLKDLDLIEAYDLKPIIDGKTLAQALDSRPGPWMKSALEVVMAWQLQHPDTATTEDAIEIVQAALSSGQVPNPATGELIRRLIHHFLLLTIRPLFSQTQNSHSETVTPAGRARKVPEGGPRRHASLEDESVTRPWKGKGNEHALPLLKWCVHRLSTKTTEQELPLLIPPILTLLDDLSTPYRAFGAELLIDLISATSSAFLARTGLIQVFTSALERSLHLLPSLTAETESIDLLKTVYPAIFSLINADHLSSSERIKAIRNVFHEHILPSLAHISPGSGVATAYPNLTSLLLEQMQVIVHYLKFDTIAQLIYIIPVLQEILEDPLASLSKEGISLLSVAAQTLSLTLSNAYPRSSHWRGTVISALASAWINLTTPSRSNHAPSGTIIELDEEEVFSNETKNARKALRECAVTLIKCIDAQMSALKELGELDEDVDVRQELKGATDADERLERLFGELTR